MLMHMYTQHCTFGLMLLHLGNVTIMCVCESVYEYVKRW